MVGFITSSNNQLAHSAIGCVKCFPLWYDEEVYKEQTRGFIDESKPNFVCKLHVFIWP